MLKNHTVLQHRLKINGEINDGNSLSSFILESLVFKTHLILFLHGYTVRAEPSVMVTGLSNLK